MTGTIDYLCIVQYTIVVQLAHSVELIMMMRVKFVEITSPNLGASVHAIDGIVYVTMRGPLRRICIKFYETSNKHPIGTRKSVPLSGILTVGTHAEIWNAANGAELQLTGILIRTLIAGIKQGNYEGLKKVIDAITSKLAAM